jgi:hypothetical protein
VQQKKTLTAKHAYSFSSILRVSEYDLRLIIIYYSHSNISFVAYNSMF